MAPVQISDVKVVKDHLKDEITFTLKNVDTRVANSLRRTILSDIECVVFKTFPDEANQCKITTNKSLFHNEIVKQRLSCIPITRHAGLKLDDTIEMVLSVKNESNVVRVVTTEDFKLRRIRDPSDDAASDDSKSDPSEEDVRATFPPKIIDGKKYYITFLRLRPQISDTILGEEIALTCKFKVGTAKESGMFNVVSKCSYVFTPDVLTSNRVWMEKEKETKGGTREENKLEETNWKLLDAKRYFIPNSFDFTIRGIGIYSPNMIVKLACQTIIKQLKALQTHSENAYIITDNDTTMTNSKDYILVNGDYTIGKILECQFYEGMFPNKLVQYVSFFKKHPHDDEGVLRVTFTSPTEIATMQEYMNVACDNLILIYTQIIQAF